MVHVLIEVRGGNVVCVTTDDEAVMVAILDHDNIAAGGSNLIEFGNPDCYEQNLKAAHHLTEGDLLVDRDGIRINRE